MTNNKLTEKQLEALQALSAELQKVAGMAESSSMPKAKFHGHTNAYRQFADILRRTRNLIDLGVVGIDKELEEKINPLISKFQKLQGVRGRFPRNHQVHIKSKKGDGKGVHLQIHKRTAFLMKQAIEHDKNRHDQLRYYHYANLAVAIWASFETYNAMLFDQLYRERPELLKSSERINGAMLEYFLLGRGRITKSGTDLFSHK